MRLTNHAKVQWDVRFSHLNLADELESLKRPGRMKRKNILKQCPSHREEMSRANSEKWFMVSKSKVVFVCARGDVIVTVFPYESGKKPLPIIYERKSQ